MPSDGRSHGPSHATTPVVVTICMFVHCAVMPRFAKISLKRAFEFSFCIATGSHTSPWPAHWLSHDADDPPKYHCVVPVLYHVIVLDDVAVEDEVVLLEDVVVEDEVEVLDDVAVDDDVVELEDVVVEDEGVVDVVVVMVLVDVVLREDVVVLVMVVIGVMVVVDVVVVTVGVTAAVGEKLVGVDRHQKWSQAY